MSPAIAVAVVGLVLVCLGAGLVAQPARWAEAIERADDGELMPTLQVREQIIRLIRQWKADLVLGPRPHDYHPDHRYTGILLQDAAFMVTVPNIAPDTPALRQNPVFMYFEDGFQKPNPFSPDVAVSIDDTFSKKMDAIDAHVSQMYEWLPWLSGRLDAVPKDPAERKALMTKQRQGRIGPAVRAALVKYYGAEAGEKVQHAEPFEICEYGRRPDAAEDTSVPLSLAYIDPEGSLLEIHDLKPLHETPVPARSDRVQFVLEMKQGWFERHKIREGAFIRTDRGTLQETFFGP